MNKQTLKFFSLLAAGIFMFTVPGWAELGDPQRGEALFVGTVSFARGGAPCLACHGIAGHELGYSAGASYGPDLSGIIENYGEDGVAGVLEDLSFESMNAIYAERPLNEGERADLVAFFSQVVGGAAAQIGPALTLHVVLATVFFLGLIGLLGWRRLHGVRKPLIDQTRYGKGVRS